MIQESMPFYESAEAATKAAIQASGQSPKGVAKELWKGKTQEAAATRLMNCLNDSRDEKLTADEHIAIANIVQQFHYLHYTCAQLSHERPRFISPEAVAAEKQERFIALAKEMKLLLAGMPST